MQSKLTYDLYVDIFMAGTQGGPGALPAAEWPLCIDLGSQGVLSMDHSGQLRTTRGPQAGEAILPVSCNQPCNCFSLDFLVYAD